MACVASSAVSSQVAALPTSFLKGKSMKPVARIPGAQSAARLVVRASAEERPSILPAPVQSAVESTFGGNAARKAEAAAIIAANAFFALPALAEEEKGKIFDFNLTLPIIAVQFLLLMYALDTIWFKPVSQVMDSRDEEIRKKLTGVRDNSDEIKSLQSEAEAVLKAARAETAAQAAKMKRELAAELDAKLQASRSRIEKELETALSNLEKQKVETMKSLDAQVQTLSDEIVQKVIPFKA